MNQNQLLEDELFTEGQPQKAAPDPAEQTFTVTVDGEPRELTLDELLEAAARGLSGETAAVRRNRAANGVTDGQIYAAFVEEYPDVRPEDIPPEVWQWAEREGSLVSAYRKWELLSLRDELCAVQTNTRNRKQAVGPAQGDGEPAGVDPVAQALLGK